MKLAATLVGALLACASASAAHAVTTTLTGNFCITCLNFAPGDDTPVLFDGLPWAIGSQLTGTWQLTIAGTTYSFTANGGTLTWSAPNPHFAIQAAPADLNLPEGTLELVINGLPSSFGFAGPMIEQLCVVVEPFIPPGVPEPSTWAMMLIGFAFLGWTQRKRLRRRYTERYTANPV
jgi:PEP-CTERM motif